MDAREEEPLDMKEWAAIAATRSQVYGFLGALYCRLPDEQFVDGMGTPEMATFLDALEQADDLPEEVREGAALIRRFTANAQNEPTDALKTKVNVERTRLFRGVKPGYGPLPPYESVYADPAKDIDPFPIAAVAKIYADAGVVLPKDRCDQPDYIGFELDFMRHLCAKESAAWERGDQDEAVRLLAQENAFLNDHLVTWVPRFCDEMIKDAKLDLYQGIARLTRGIVLDESHTSATYQELARTA